MTDALRQQLIETAMAMNDSGLNQGTSGNLSVRSEKSMLITPSGMDYAGLSLDDIVRMDFDGNCQGTRVNGGSMRPSTNTTRKPMPLYTPTRSVAPPSLAWARVYRHFITWSRSPVAKISAALTMPPSVPPSFQRMYLKHWRAARPA